MITREQWDSLSDKAKWDIKAALRGPDVLNSDPIKFYTSAVVRAECRQAFRVGGMVNNYLRLVVMPDSFRAFRRDDIPAWSSFDGGHFFSHQQEAANWLNIPVLLIGPRAFEELLGRPLPDKDFLVEQAKMVVGSDPENPINIALAKCPGRRPRPTFAFASQEEMLAQLAASAKKAVKK